MTKRAILYARVSGNDKAKTGGLNLDSQLEMGRAYCKEHGYNLIAELPEDDRGASGASWDLPQLNHALELARNGEYDVLVVRELDRFARSLAKQLVIETEFKQAGVEIEYILAQYEDSPEGQLTKHVRAIIAEYEREKTKERMVRGRRNKVKNGQVLGGGVTAYGYRVTEADDQHVFEIHEDEAAIVRLVFDLYTGNERTNIRAIVQKLTDMRVLTVGGRRGDRKRKKEPWEWSASTIKRMLSCETYTGVWSYAGIPVEVPAIISREQFELAQARKAENQTLSARSRKYQYPLSGRLKCGMCGSNMTGLTFTNKGRNTVNSYYRCPVKTDPQSYSHTCTGGKYYRRDILEPLVWERVKEWLSNPQLVIEKAEQFKAAKDAENRPLFLRLEIVNDKLADLESRMDVLEEMRLDREISKEKFKARKAEYERIAVDLETEKGAIEGAIQESSLTAEQIDDLLVLHSDIVEGADSGDHDPDFQARVYARIRLRVVVTVEDTEHAAYIYCVLGDDRLKVADKSICRCGRS